MQNDLIRYAKDRPYLNFFLLRQIYRVQQNMTRNLLTGLASFRLHRKPLLSVRVFASERRPQLDTQITRPSNAPALKTAQGSIKFNSISSQGPSTSSARRRSPAWIRCSASMAIGLYLSLGLFCVFSSDQVPITGRWRFQCFATENPKLLGDENADMLVGAAGKDFESFPSSDEDPRLLRMKQTRLVLDRLLLASGLSHLQWNLIIIGTHVFVEPEGVVAMSNRMFEAADSDDEIAAVLSHQVAHFLARHAEEQSSKKLIGRLTMLPAIPSVAPWLFFRKLISLAPLGLIVPSIALSISLLLRTSHRDLEFEADDIGLLLMAEAGFDPRAAATFWKKMNGLKRGVSKLNGPMRTADWILDHAHDDPAISRIASNAWKSLYLTGNGHLPSDLSSEELHELELAKRRWDEFLRQRPSRGVILHFESVRR
ncbi:MAG: hypothetical protein Q9192_006793 [Flavoplaca navasiana]